MEESHKRMRTSSSSNGSPSNAIATAVVKKEQGRGSSAQRPAAASWAAARGAASVNYQASSSSGSAAGSGHDDTGSSNIVIVDKHLWLHCSGCRATLKPPSASARPPGTRCAPPCRGSPESGNPCRACGNNNGAAAAYTRCSGDDLDGLMRALRVPCPYKAYSGYGCRGLVPYISVDEHRRSCVNPPCSCSVFPCSGGGFLGSPRALHEHLTGPALSWPTTDIDYRGKALQLGLTLTGPENRRLLVSKDDDGRVFLLAAAGETPTRMAHVSLTCLRASRTAGPQYRARLWAHAARDPVAGIEDRLDAEFLIESRREPREIGAEEDGTVLSLKPKFLHGCGGERKVQLYIRIAKLIS